MPTLDDYARQSRFTDPGRYAPLLDQLPASMPELAAVVHNVIAQYRGAGPTITGERLAEVDLRWLERILATDQARFPGAGLAEPRPRPERVAGCCRDFTLLAVAALRHRGLPARSRVGFAAYFTPGFHHDHVIAEYWDGARWVFVDAGIEPGTDWPPFDRCDLPCPLGAAAPVPAHYNTAAQAWAAHRAGAIDAERYGVDPDGTFRGAWFVRDEVFYELAHRQRDELLLWDVWGTLLDGDGDGDAIAALADEVAALLLAADGGDETAERELSDWYARDPRLHPGERVRSFSPTGNTAWIDLRR